MMAETAAGTFSRPLAGRHRLSRDMAVDPLHGIGGGERQCAGEHLIERDAERVEVAAGIDRAIHPSGLFGRHVGERAGDGLGRLGRLPLARQARGDAEPGEPDLVRSSQFTRIWAGLRSLWTRPRWWSFAQRGGDADGEAQEAPHLHGRAEQPVERLAARILEHQHGPAAFARQAPAAAPPTLPSSSSFKPYSCARRSRLAGAGAPQRAARPARRGGCRRRPGATPGRRRASAVLPQDLEVALYLSAEPKG